MNQNTPLTELKGIGEKTAKLFAKLHISTVGDLIHYYPKDYETFHTPTTVAASQVNEVCSILATVKSNFNFKKLRNLTIGTGFIGDSTGQISMTYFNMPFLRNVLVPGSIHIFRGLLQRKNNHLVMEQAKIFTPMEYEKLTGFLQPKYPLTAGLTNNMITKALKQALSSYDFTDDFLPTSVIKENHLISHKEALIYIHFPDSFEQMKEARKRLVFEEFFLFILHVQFLKEHNSLLKNQFPMIEVADTKRLIEELPYRLTSAQQRVWDEIQTDLTGNLVMNRLIQGDVGSGKTIIAFLSLLLCVVNGYQGALMAPTEILAKQHMENIEQLITRYHLPFRPVLIVGSMSAKEKREAYLAIASGERNVIIGTNALIQEKVVYKNLALAITDEQHRFGVRQRESLAQKGENVHVLVMSATPIPRTLAIILYGDLQVSVIDELPADRLPIKNCVVDTSYRDKAYSFITKEVAAGRQVYVICPMVEEGEQEGVENVLEYTEKLKNALPPSIEVCYLHGKMKGSDKNRIMEAFGNHEIDVLVSTTVIEVGINVPNATIMMVENAERFGLAQLHQLRGRVGRGKDQSYCIFVSGNDKEETMKRLKILNQSNDGFFIANEDLKLRGPGDLFGIRQSGEMNFIIADIYNDSDILQQASQAAKKLLMMDETLSAEEHIALRQYLELTYLKSVDFRTI